MQSNRYKALLSAKTITDKIFDFNKSAGFSPAQEALEIIGVS